MPDKPLYKRLVPSNKVRCYWHSSKKADWRITIPDDENTQNMPICNRCRDEYTEIYLEQIRAELKESGGMLVLNTPYVSYRESLEK